MSIDDGVEDLSDMKIMNAPDISNTEVMPPVKKVKERTKWSASQKKLLALVSAIFMLNSVDYMHTAAYTPMFVTVGPFKIRQGACALRGLTFVLTNLLAPAAVDYIGCYLILLLGTLLMCLSPVEFAFANSDMSVITASIGQGIVAALIDTTASVAVASTFKRRVERYEAFAVMWGARYFGRLVLVPLATLWKFFRRSDAMPAAYALINLTIFLMLSVCDMSVINHLTKLSKFPKPSVSMWKVVSNWEILVKIGLLILSAEVFTLAYFSHERPIWLYLRHGELARLLVWLPCYVPYALGAILTVVLSKKFPHYMMQAMILSMAVASACTYVQFLIGNYWYRMIPISYIPFSIAIVDVAVSVSFAQHMEDHHDVSSYGAIYAIANIAYSLTSTITYSTGNSIEEYLRSY